VHFMPGMCRHLGIFRWGICRLCLRRIFMGGLGRARSCDGEYEILEVTIDHPKTPVHPLFTVPSGLYLYQYQTTDRIVEYKNIAKHGKVRSGRASLTHFLFFSHFSRFSVELSQVIKTLLENLGYKSAIKTRYKIMIKLGRTNTSKRAQTINPITKNMGSLKRRKADIASMKPNWKRNKISPTIICVSGPLHGGPSRWAIGLGQMMRSRRARLNVRMMNPVTMEQILKTIWNGARGNGFSTESVGNRAS